MPEIPETTACDYPQPGKYITYRAPGFIAHACPDYRMVWQGREYLLEWHPYFGPSRLKKDGNPYDRQPGMRHPFWDGIAAWTAAGQRADNEGRCIMEACNG